MVILEKILTSLRWLVELNLVAVLLCGLGISFIESVWFSNVLFRKRWQQELGISDKDIDQITQRWSYAANFILHLVLCFIIAIIVNRQSIHTFVEGALLGLLLGGILGITQALNYIYEKRSWTFYFIMVGYPLLAFVLIGGIFAVWN